LLAVSFSHLGQDLFGNLVNSRLAIPRDADFSILNEFANLEYSVFLECQCVIVKGKGVGSVYVSQHFKLIDNVFRASRSKLIPKHARRRAEGTLEWASSAGYDWEKQLPENSILA
jgi:hypothetical protein